MLSPTESIISKKKGTKADIKLQVSVWQKATIWCVFYTLQNLRDKWEAVKKWFPTQNNNDPKNKLTKHIQQIYLSIYHLHSYFRLFLFFLFSYILHFCQCLNLRISDAYSFKKIIFLLPLGKLELHICFVQWYWWRLCLYSFFRKSSSNGLKDDFTPRIMRDSANI